MDDVTLRPPDIRIDAGSDEDDRAHRLRPAWFYQTRIKAGIRLFLLADHSLSDCLRIVLFSIQRIRDPIERRLYIG